jgi:hypothetical protein
LRLVGDGEEMDGVSEEDSIWGRGRKIVGWRVAVSRIV